MAYSMGVIIARALPDVRDGLKPSQRRILVAMNDLGLGPPARQASAGIVGETMKRYHRGRRLHLSHPHAWPRTGCATGWCTGRELRLDCRSAARPDAIHGGPALQMAGEMLAPTSTATRSISPKTTTASIASRSSCPASCRTCSSTRGRHRRRHGYRNPAAQPSRSLRSQHLPHRQPGGHPR